MADWKGAGRIVLMVSAVRPAAFLYANLRLTYGLKLG
jgi:hypothetical protein